MDVYEASNILDRIIPERQTALDRVEAEYKRLGELKKPGQGRISAVKTRIERQQILLDEVLQLRLQCDEHKQLDQPRYTVILADRRAGMIFAELVHKYNLSGPGHARAIIDEAIQAEREADS